MKRLISCILIVLLLKNNVFNCFAATVEDDYILTIPKPIKVVDFSQSLAQLKENDSGFYVEENDAAPILVNDEEMGQVLKLNKAIIKNQVFHPEIGYIISDESQYSTIHISNPYVGVEHLIEYEPYEDVETTMYDNREQPLWDEGISISYWIKTPLGDDGIGINSNVIGFTSERFQVEANDYAYYIDTLKYDMDYNKYTQEEKELLGISLPGVDSDSDFYFSLADETLYEGKPLYDNDSLGSLYWLNKNFSNGYIKYNDGIIKAYDDLSDRQPYEGYEYYSEYPTFGYSEEEHDPGTSNLRYAWTYSEMWLDASSSFYFENDNEYTNEQLNPNHATSYGTVMGMQHKNSFSANSWRGSVCAKDANESGLLADSPISFPDEWHYVVAIIQNDWIKFYLDGKEIEVKDMYSSYGSMGFLNTSKSFWGRFNKGTGSRYGYGSTTLEISKYSPGYTSPTIMEWITSDCVNLTIGGGNRNGDAYCMYADTADIYLKNVVFYDIILTDDQIKYLSSNPFIYQKEVIADELVAGDINNDKIVNSEDALIVLKHAGRIEHINDDLIKVADLNADDIINSEDALLILKIAAKL